MTRQVSAILRHLPTTFILLFFCGSVPLRCGCSVVAFQEERSSYGKTPLLRSEEDRVTSLPGFGEIDASLYGRQWAGYLPVDDKWNSSLFYWFLEVLPPRDPFSSPLVLWLNGGPGCSSMTGAFMENGLFVIEPDMQLSLNNKSWTNHANMLYIDQPLGTGFSFVRHKDSYLHDENAIAQQLLNALLHFHERHRDYAALDFYITGESYAGKYIPALATHILQHNSQAGENSIPLKGIAIGDGLVDPITQRFVYAEQAAANALLGSNNQREQLEELAYLCKREIMAERYESGLDPCDDMLTFIKMSSGDINEYDIRKFGAPYNRTLKAAYLSQPALRESLHIADLQPFVNCNNTVKDNLAGDILQSVVGLLPNLLRNMRVLLYGGQFDLKDGPLGTARYLETVNWEGRQSYLQAPRNLWLVNKSDSGTKASKVESTVGGYVKASGNLTFLVISGAGHFAPMDQRNNVLDMLRRFLADEPFCAARSQTAPQASSQDETSSPKVQARRRLYGWDGFSNERRQSGEDQQTCFLDDKLYCDLLQDCNKRGTCSGGRCKCQEGYTGTRCQHTQQQLSINEKVYESNIQALEWKYYFFYIAPTQIGTDSITFITLTGMRDGSSVQQQKVLGLYLQAGKPPTERSFFASSRANTTRHFLSVQLEAGIKYTVGVFNTGASNSSFTLSLETLDTALLPSSSCEDEPSSSMAACSLWVDALLITLAVLGVLLIIFVAVVVHYRGKLKAQNSPFQELALPATMPTMADQDEDYDEGDIKAAKKLRLSRTEP